jgi:nucleoside 2-deoxyribosyltransferase
MVPAYDVYLAGPFFTPDQKATMDAAKNLLTEFGLSVCDPRDLNGVIVDDPELRKADRLKKIYEDNIEGMRNSWSIIACIDDRDTGTAFELGWIIGQQHKRVGPVITFSGNGYGCNVMLSQATDAHFDYVADLQTFGADVLTGIMHRSMFKVHTALMALGRAKAEASE